jgi:hypothetical protein
MKVPVALDVKTDDALERHVFSTYISLRVGMAAVAAALPFIMWFGGRAHGISLQDSLSDYYHAEPDTSTARALFAILLCLVGVLVYVIVQRFVAEKLSIPQLIGGAIMALIVLALIVLLYSRIKVYATPMRTPFVGVIFMIGSFLYLYKGYGDGENYLLNLAAISAVLVALFPNDHNCGSSCPTFNAHGTFAVIFFVCIALVAILYSRETLGLVKDENRKRLYRAAYLLLGFLMPASAVLAFIVNVSLDVEWFVFFIEGVAIELFAAYWLVKSLELRETQAERKALHGNVDPKRGRVGLP